MQAAQMSIKRGMDKEDVVLIYNETLLRHQTERKKMSFAATQRDPEITILSEVKEEKEKYLMTSLRCGI